MCPSSDGQSIPLANTYIPGGENEYRGIVPFLHTYTSLTITHAYTTSVHSPSRLMNSLHLWCFWDSIRIIINVAKLQWNSLCFFVFQIEHNIHFLDITSVESPVHNRVSSTAHSIIYSRMKIYLYITYHVLNCMKAKKYVEYMSLHTERKCEMRDHKDVDYNYTKSSNCHECYCVMLCLTLIAMFRSN